MALARTLSSKPDLALHIKRLRLNGGYGRAAATVLHAVPHLEHLCLAVGVLFKENINPMCKALKDVNPVRVSVYDNRVWFGQNTKVRQLLETVCQCIKGPWSNMMGFDYPYDNRCSPGLGDYLEKSTLIIESLAEAPNLRILYVPCAGTLASNPVVKILANLSLQSVVCRRPPRSFFDREVKKDGTGKLRTLVKFPGDHDDHSGDDPFITSEVDTFRICRRTVRRNPSKCRGTGLAQPQPQCPVITQSR